MDIQTAVGLAAGLLMIICYAFERLSPWTIFVFGLAAFVLAGYCISAGAWPFGGLAAIWGLVAFRRWQRQRLAEVS